MSENRNIGKILLNTSKHHWEIKAVLKHRAQTKKTSMGLFLIGFLLLFHLNDVVNNRLD